MRHWAGDGLWMQRDVNVHDICDISDGSPCTELQPRLAVHVLRVRVVVVRVCPAGRPIEQLLLRLPRCRRHRFHRRRPRLGVAALRDEGADGLVGVVEEALGRAVDPAGKPGTGQRSVSTITAQEGQEEGRRGQRLQQNEVTHRMLEAW